MPLLLAQEDMQALGSAITYARRYTLQSVLNLVSERRRRSQRRQHAGTGKPAPATRHTAATKMITQAAEETGSRKH